MQGTPETRTSANTPLQLLLFVDKRPHSGEQIQQVRRYLKDFKTHQFELTVIDVEEQPHMAEHFKVVATPALIKVHPEPRQRLAGRDMATSLANWLPRWLHLTENPLNELAYKTTDPSEDETTAVVSSPPSMDSVDHLAELIQLSDEVFRLKQEKEQLQEQLQFKERILAMLAHDLRNPLTAASLAVETLQMGHHAPESSPRLSSTLTAQLLKHARTQIKAMDRMIADILQMAQGTGTKLNIQLHVLDLGSLCADVVEDLTELFQTKSQKVNTDIPQDLPMVYADPERVRQVVINLLDNASKYTPIGGTIEVSILHRTTQKVQVSICDTGLGIPDENQERIFEESFRLERDVAKEGYGIGLALCRRIVRAHYGQIWVDCAGGQGSCFHFTLPVYRS